MMSEAASFLEKILLHGSEKGESSQPYPVRIHRAGHMKLHEGGYCNPNVEAI